MTKTKMELLRTAKELAWKMATRGRQLRILRRGDPPMSMITYQEHLLLQTECLFDTTMEAIDRDDELQSEGEQAIRTIMGACACDNCKGKREEGSIFCKECLEVAKKLMGDV